MLAVELSVCREMHERNLCFPATKTAKVKSEEAVIVLNTLSLSLSLSLSLPPPPSVGLRGAHLGVVGCSCCQMRFDQVPKLLNGFGKIGHEDEDAKLGWKEPAVLSPSVLGDFAPNRFLINQPFQQPL